MPTTTNMIECLFTRAKKLEDELIEAMWNEDPRAEIIESNLKLTLDMLNKGETYEPLF